MLKKDFSLSVKDVSGEGTFEGYASTFGGSPDSYGDIIAAGAFAETMVKHRREGTMPMMFFGHDMSELPIGDWLEMAEDGKGLWAKGQLDLEDPVSVRVHRALKQKRVRGLSIGYSVPVGGAKPDEKRPGVTVLEKIDLIEVSIVNRPANKRSLVDDVKTDAPARWWALHDRLRGFDGLPDNTAEMKKEIEEMLQMEACPKSLRAYFAKRLVTGRSESDRPIRSESEGDQANDATAFLKALRG